jgi:hypothetical protein
MVRSAHIRSTIQGGFEQTQEQIAARVRNPLDPGRSYSAQIHSMLRDAISWSEAYVQYAAATTR